MIAVVNPSDAQGDVSVSGSGKAEPTLDILPGPKRLYSYNNAPIV